MFVPHTLSHCRGVDFSLRAGPTVAKLYDDNVSSPVLLFFPVILSLRVDSVCVPCVFMVWVQVSWLWAGMDRTARYSTGHA